MKTLNTFVMLCIAIFTLSCASTKNTNSTALYDTTWELEYLTGPRIAFDGLFPDKKPYITFDKTNGVVSGNNGCNGYSAPFTIKNNNITFGEPGPSTLMYCGEGEVFFLNTIKKVNKFNVDSKGKLHLMLDDLTMMTFKKQ
ncbi:META domain-containing protein [Siansivirga zeaxanthinifaciens]|uniref:DUF306 domain-containing protein n=1 Tax=Siansivirga zeaxanthinifaciens CC-SAMT-1 TaxID=1454006 RepID=A0A0C5WF34_9FLAO|nr:META domain-containing protein [Siansivirga zeaxanthinifaciens]AJR03824.1 hypothetical protein AW14_09545 [Siansivirga zeaxanthinifaciens CC-SAMT-1]